MKTSWTTWLLLIIPILVVTSCGGKPKGIEPVANFSAEKYLGTWYEIARLDHSYERGLAQVTATYSLREDGGIKVVNRGYSADKKDWEESIGKAYFVDDATKGYLKVSFYGPFYASYVVFDIGDKYEYALVTASDRSYFWLLARNPKMDEATKTELVKKAAALGFETSKLIYVEQPD